MTALIISFPTDVHAVCAQWGLLKKGVGCDLLSYADFPTCGAATYDPVGDRSWIVAPQVSHSSTDYAVVWNRRVFFGPPPAFLDSADWPQVESSRRRLVEDFALVGARSAAWVNPQGAKRRANSKAYQLRLASELGFDVAPTIISNDPPAIRDFVSRTGDCIVKPLTPMAWARDGYQVAMMTTPVTLADLTQDQAVRACPMIYQKRVEKAVEYRVVVFGSEVVCVEIDSQATRGAELDWRSVPSQRLTLTEVPCPEPLKARLLRFMREAELLFGAFDLARTPDGEFTFFEINEQGQFLWIEEINPDIRLLDRMAAFLLDPRAGFTYRLPSDGGITCEEAMASEHVTTALRLAESRHEDVVWNLATAE
jgi:glutathione synthase/RimK-type ligase-like ATP-grasp enzyme